MEYRHWVSEVFGQTPDVAIEDIEFTEEFGSVSTALMLDFVDCMLDANELY